MKYLSILFLVCLSWALTAQTIVTDRPDQTESSSTIPKGALQLESGVLVGFTEDNDNAIRQIYLPTTLFRVGLFEGFELRVVSQLAQLKEQFDDVSITGMADLEVGFKAQLFQRDDVNTEVAFLSHLVMPTGSVSLGSENFGTVNKLSISHSLTEEMGLGYNVGYNYFGEGSGDLTYSLALGIGITDKVSVYIEPYGELANMDTFIANFDAGGTYLLKDNLQLDFSFGLGINQDMNYVAAGVSWLIMR